jgi:hypothetical protein
LASVGPGEHKKFCEIDQWTERKSARGKKPDHDRFEKHLRDGTILLTKVSRNTKEYGPGLWKHIWSEQLKLESETQFFEALRSGKPVPRPGDQERAPDGETIPGWLVQQLHYTAGVAIAEIKEMTAAEAHERWERYQRGEP